MPRWSNASLRSRRASYIDPRVIDRFHGGATIAEALRGRSPDLSRPRVRARIEAATLDLLAESAS